MHLFAKELCLFQENNYNLMKISGLKEMEREYIMFHKPPIRGGAIAGQFLFLICIEFNKRALTGFSW